MVDGRGSSHAGWRRAGRWMVLLAAAAVFVPWTAGEASAAAPGALQVAAAVSPLSSETPSTVVTVTNTGGTPVTGVAVSAAGPAWTKARLTSGRRSGKSLTLGTIAPGSTTLVRLSATVPLGGRAGTITLRAVGTSGVELVTVATVQLAAATPVVSVELTGAGVVGDHSPGLVTIVVRNDSEVAVPVGLEASGDGVIIHDPGGPVPRSDNPAPWRGVVTVEPHQASTTDVAVAAVTPVRPRHVTLVVTSRVSTGDSQPVQLVTTHDLDLTIAANDLVPTVAGIGSTLVLPGLGALLAFLGVRERDRAKVGVARRSVASTVWDNKLLLLLALVVSLAAVWALDWVTGVDLVATPWSGWLVVLTGLATLVGLGVAEVMVRLHRSRVPLITSDSTVGAVLQAAAKRGERRRQVYPSTAEQRGVFVHRDYDLVVLAPPVWFSKPGDLTEKGTLAEIAAAAANRPEFQGGFTSADGWVKVPTPVPAGTAWTGEWAEIVSYVDLIAPPAPGGG